MRLLDFARVDWVVAHHQLESFGALHDEHEISWLLFGLAKLGGEDFVGYVGGHGSPLCRTTHIPSVGSFPAIDP